MIRLLLAALAALFVTAAQAQVSDKDHVWSTPGNAQVGGAVQMCQNGLGLAVACTNTTAAGGYPPGATPAAQVSTGTTGGTNANLASAAGKTLYICGFNVSPGSATAAITITVTVTNLIIGNQSYTIGAPVTAAGITGAVLTQNFNPCIPANSTNQGIAVQAGALGTGGVGQAVNAWGYIY